MKKLFAFAIILGAMMVAMVAQGQVTYTATFSGNDLRNLPDGVYIYSVNCEGCSQTGKIVIGK